MTDMTTFDRIKKLAEKRGKSLPAVSADLEFSDNLFYRWKTSNPKATDLAKVADYWVMIGGIDHGNPGSIHLHKKLGFTYCGTLKAVGYKFNQLLDLDYYQLDLRADA